jgi:hypothetical protein
MMQHADKFEMGDIVFLRAEIRPGPFADERRVYLKLGDLEWLGFVHESEIKEEQFVGARVLRVEGDIVALGINGTSPQSRAFRTARDTLIEHGALAT